MIGKNIYFIMYLFIFICLPKIIIILFYLQKQCLNRLHAEAKQKAFKKKRYSPPQKSSPKVVEQSLKIATKAHFLKTSRSELYDYLERKRSLKNDLAAHCNSKEEARKRIVAVKTHLKEKAGENKTTAYRFFFCASSRHPTPILLILIHILTNTFHKSMLSYPCTWQEEFCCPIEEWEITLVPLSHEFPER